MGLGDFFKGAGSGLISGAASLLGGGISAITGKQSRDREYERQKEFAQNGIRWKVEDAKAAGIHPIYAIGANTPTYSPQAAVGTDFGLSQAGQDISRAIEAKQTRNERAENEAVSRSVGEAQANYYNAAARNQDAQADLAGQRSVAEALSDIRKNFIDTSLAKSQRSTTKTALPPSMPSTYDDLAAGVVPYVVGDRIFEFPPSDVADLMEDPKIFAAWKAAIEYAWATDPKLRSDFIKKLPQHIQGGIKSGSHEIVRIPGIGLRYQPKSSSKISSRPSPGGIRGFYSSN